MIWGPDPSDPEGDHGSMKVLTRGKNNLARDTGQSATFTIAEKVVTGGIKAPYLIRGDDRQVAADDVIADRETRTAREEAVEWLRAKLANGPVPANEAETEAGKVGISSRTLRRAKQSLRVISEQARADTSISGWICWTCRPCRPSRGRWPRRPRRPR